jgi:hypothetical protein
VEMPRWRIEGGELLINSIAIEAERAGLQARRSPSQSGMPDL